MSIRPGRPPRRFGGCFKNRSVGPGPSEAGRRVDLTESTFRSRSSSPGRIGRSVRVEIALPPAAARRRAPQDAPSRAQRGGACVNGRRRAGESVGRSPARVRSPESRRSSEEDPQVMFAEYATIAVSVLEGAGSSPTTDGIDVADPARRRERLRGLLNHGRRGAGRAPGPSTARRAYRIVLVMEQPPVAAPRFVGSLATHMA